MDPATTNALVATIAAIFGGISLKIVESLLARKSREADIGFSLRDELRSEIQSLKADLKIESERGDALEARFDILKKEHYLLMERVIISYKDGTEKESLLSDIQRHLGRHKDD